MSGRRRNLEQRWTAPTRRADSTGLLALAATASAVHRRRFPPIRPTGHDRSSEGNPVTSRQGAPDFYQSWNREGFDSKLAADRRLGEHADGSSPVGRVRRGGRIHGSFFRASDPPCLVNRCRGDAASDWSRLLSVFGSAEAVTDLGVLKDGLVRGPPGVFVPPLYMARKSCSDDVNLDPERLGDLGTRPFPARR